MNSIRIDFYLQIKPQYADEYDTDKLKILFYLNPKCVVRCQLAISITQLAKKLLTKHSTVPVQEVL
ncbi:hypothetical protein LOAG_08705 [Loa loa]|uniref:Uncharacterized protein n=1 Tax=Loa loa TaxID=7209 RepID=A0A1S0TTB6_LOALO|nr:hypothetical protein LOAG_08705 [Loa loa]EFO19785.1 hypothetical protein LOAG_08705 [Loa loa]